MRRRYEDPGKPIRTYKKGERIQVFSMDRWQNATVVGYEISSGKVKVWKDEPFPLCLLYVKIDGDRRSYSCGYQPTTTYFRDLVQESLL